MHKLGLAVVVIVAACGGSASSTAKAQVPARPAPTMIAGPAPVAAAEPPAPPAAPTFPGTPAGPAGDQLAWLFDGMVNRHGVFELAELTAHFHPSFVAKVPLAQLHDVLATLGHDSKDLTIKAVKADNPNQLVASVTTGTTPLRVTLAVDATTGQIIGLLFQPETDAGAKPASFAEADKLLTAFAPHAQLLVAALDHGACKPIHALASHDELAIGSAFKLYVLLGLVDRIAAGKLAWDTELAVRDDWKSLPSGITQNDPAGTKLSVTTLAERMISISDNTATDHVLYTVGRPEVEAALTAARHARPALDIPFVSTREMFLFKLAMTPKQIDDYLAMKSTLRRGYLDQALAGRSVVLDGLPDWTAARRIDRLEWYASSDDLCRVMGTLWQRGQNPRTAPLLAVLARNPGLPIDKQVWPYVGFKGGSEPGVINLTYLLRRDDDRWFVVTASANSNEGGTVDEHRLFSIVEGVVELTAGVQRKPH